MRSPEQAVYYVKADPLLGKEKEIVEAARDGHLAGVDPVGVGHDAALLGLPNYS